MFGSLRSSSVRPRLRSSPSAAARTAPPPARGPTPGPPAPDAGHAASLAAMLDSTKCLACHKEHYADWSQSMHAYASDDPVFLAMNKSGQRETNGQLGNFCVNCHAPMAVRQSPGQNVGAQLAAGQSLDPALK